MRVKTFRLNKEETKMLLKRFCNVIKTIVAYRCVQTFQKRCENVFELDTESIVLI